MRTYREIAADLVLSRIRHHGKPLAPLELEQVKGMDYPSDGKVIAVTKDGGITYSKLKNWKQDESGAWVWDLPGYGTTPPAKTPEEIEAAITAQYLDLIARWGPE